MAHDRTGWRLLGVGAGLRSQGHGIPVLALGEEAQKCEPPERLFLLQKIRLVKWKAEGVSAEPRRSGGCDSNNETMGGWHRGFIWLVETPRGGGQRE